MGNGLSLRERSASRIRRREGAIWQRRFWEHQIRDVGDFEAHVHYIHFNAVKHGLVRKPIDWAHSSFRRFVKNGVIGQIGVGWMIGRLMSVVSEYC